VTATKVKGWKPSFEGERPSLGATIIAWIDSLNLKVPAGELLGEDFELRPSQERWFANAYMLDPGGRRMYRQGLNIGPKGNGKSPTGALTALVELCGPCQFDGWDSAGRPVARPRGDSYVGIVGTSEDQGANQYDWLFSALTMPGVTAADDLGLTVDLSKIETRSGGYGTLETFTSSAKSATGKPVSYWSCEESWLWTRASGGHQLAKTILNEIRKANAWVAWHSNPAELGIDSVTERQLKAASNAGSGIYVHRRSANLPAAIADGGIKRPEHRELVLAAIADAYGDALISEGGWIDPEQILDGIYEPLNTESDGYRLFLGVEWDAASKLIRASDFEALEKCDPIPAGTKVVCSMDGSESRDSTVVQVWSLDPIHGQTVQAWHRPLGEAGEGFKIPKDEVSEAVAFAQDRWDVVLMVCDPRGWETQINEWQRTYGNVVTLATNSQYQNMDEAVSIFTAHVEAGSLSWCGDQVLDDSGTFIEDPSDPVDSRMRQHVLAMVLKIRSQKYKTVDSETKSDDARIDGGVGAILGTWGVERALNEAPTESIDDSWGGASWGDI